MGNVLRRFLDVRRRLRLQLFLLRARLLAAAGGARLELAVHGTVEVARGARINVQPRTRNVVRMGAGCRIQDDVLIHLKGGELHFGERVEVRRGTVLNLSGVLRCAGRNIISYSNVIHCAEAIELDLYASTNEFVSIIDSTHHHDGEHEFFYENVSSAPISIGRNSWICNKSSVLLGVRVGHNAVVASHAVVNRDVPDGAVAAGMPARVIADRVVGGPALRFFDDEPSGAADGP